MRTPTITENILFVPFGRRARWCDRFIDFCSKLAIPITLSAGWFLGGLAYSVLFAVFPATAVKKGLSETEIGLIIGIFEMASMIGSVLLGTFLSQLGPKFVFICGMSTFSCTVALFGFLDWGPDGTVYLVMCVLVRIFQGASFSAVLVASCAILMKTYPDHFTTVIATLEMLLNVGMTVGPPIGGLLHDHGGFVLTFNLVAAISIVNSLAALCIFRFCRVAKVDDDFIGEINSQGSVVSLLKIPVVAFTALILVTLFSMYGFYLSTLSLILSQRYALSATINGLIFLLQALMICAGSQLWGLLGDKKPAWINSAFVFGFLTSSLSFVLFIPAPYLPLSYVPLWLAVFLQVPIGLGTSVYVLGARKVQIELLNAGFDESFRTYGLVTGFYNTFLCLGFFLGPFVGGVLADNLGYETALIIGVAISTSLAILLIIRPLLKICWWHFCNAGRFESDETIPFAKCEDNLTFKDGMNKATVRSG